MGGGQAIKLVRKLASVNEWLTCILISCEIKNGKCDGWLQILLILKVDVFHRSSVPIDVGIDVSSYDLVVVLEFLRRRVRMASLRRSTYLGRERWIVRASFVRL
jgi:hypothetical protein